MIKDTTGNYTPLIYWVYEVAGEIPKDRCEKVSRIIQARIDSKTWNQRYFRTGSKDEYSYPVICFIGEKEQSCNEENIIIKLKETEDAARVLDEMLAFKQRTYLKLTGEARSYCDEVSEDICYDIDKFLEAVTDFYSGQ